MGYLFGQATGTTSGGGGTPALPHNSVQFNNAGAFGGSTNFTWDNVNDVVTLSGSATGFSQLNLIGGATGAPGLTLTDTAGGQAWDVLASSAFLIYASVAGTPTDLGFQISQSGAGLVTASQLVAQGKTLGITGVGAINLNSSEGNAGQITLSQGSGAAAIWANTFSLNDATGTLTLGSTTLPGTLTASAGATTASAGENLVLNSGPGGSVSGASGNVIIATPAATGSASGKGGNITLLAGNGSPNGTGAAASGGSITIGAGTSGGNVGGVAPAVVTIFSGAGSATASTGNGGAISLQAGTGKGTVQGNGGGFTLTAGAATVQGSGGAFAMTAGAGIGTGAGGGFTLTSGTGGSGTGAGGNLSLVGGAGGSGGGAGASVNISAGNSTLSSGGTISITAGTGTTNGTIGLNSPVVALSTIEATASALVASQTQVVTGVAAYKAADSTANSNVLTADATLTITLNETGLYEFELFLPFYEAAVSTGGFQFDLNGGTATVSDIVYGITGFVTAVFGAAAVTALNTATGAATVSGSAAAPSWFLAKGSMDINGTGTVIPRWAQNSTLGADPTTLKQGAYLKFTKIG